MPSLARLYLRTGLVYLFVGGLLGGLILWNKGAPFSAALWSWLPAHISLMTWGWLWHLTMGVAFWILPRFGSERGRVWLAWGAYLCLNFSLWLAAATPWLRYPVISLLAGLLQLLAGLAFTFHAWPRVRASAYGK